VAQGKFVKNSLVGYYSAKRKCILIRGSIHNIRSMFYSALCMPFKLLFMQLHSCTWSAYAYPSLTFRCTCLAKCFSFCSDTSDNI